MITALPDKHGSVQWKSSEEEGDQRTRRKETWRKKCGQQEEDGAGRTR